MRNKSFEYQAEIDSYFCDIKKYHPIDKWKEKELAQKIKNGDEFALNELITSNLKFVVMIAKTYRNVGIPFSELIAEGNVGLIKAAKKFDGEKDIKFITYAVWWIKNSIQECIEKFNKNNCYDVDDYVFDGKKDGESSDSINDEYEANISEITNKKEAVDELMSCLKDREIKILKLYYGLDNNKEMTLDEIGKGMNLTQERVRQIKDKALIKLRSNALMSDDFEELKTLI